MHILVIFVRILLSVVYIALSSELVFLLCIECHSEFAVNVYYLMRVCRI